MTMPFCGGSQIGHEKPNSIRLAKTSSLALANSITWVFLTGNHVSGVAG